MERIFENDAPFACAICRPSRPPVIEGYKGAFGKEGDSCGDGLGDCDLSLGLACSEEKRCAPVRIVGLGEPCRGISLIESPRADQEICVATAHCINDTCVTARGLDEPCTRECRAGLACRDGRCKVKFAGSTNDACNP